MIPAYFLGIDPGKTGGLCIIDLTGNICNAMPMPINGKELDIARVLGFIKTQNTENMIAAIERVSAMPGQGVSSMFTFGFGVGTLHGIIRTLGIPLYNPTPQAWQKVSGGLNGGNKAVTASWACRMYPNHDFRASERCKNVHEGIIDAVGIANWLYQTTTRQVFA